MTAPRDPDGSTRIGQDDRFATTGTGQDVTGRMAGTGAGATTGRDTVSRTDTVDRRDVDLVPAKTSAAATFALVFGLSALFCALTAILAPAAVVFGLIGLVLGIVGIKKGKLPHVTGHKVAIGGLDTALLGLLLGGAVLGGAAALVNNESALDRITQKVDQLRADLPSATQVKDQVTN